MLLPTLDALFNACAAVCLVFGYVFIRRKNIAAHRTSMLSAFAFSVAFLGVYLTHHAQVGSVPFRGTGAWRVAISLDSPRCQCRPSEHDRRLRHSAHLGVRQLGQ